MKRIKVGINGFGRIGRAVTRIALNRDTFDVVAINTRKTTNEMMAYLLQYDSVYRRFAKRVTPAHNGLNVDGNLIPTIQSPTPEEIPWEKYGVDVVVDATGAFTTKPDLEKHLHGTVKKVILTAPSKDEDTPHVVLGVNDDQIKWDKETVISNASCTTNCASPMFKVLHDHFHVLSGSFTTSHAYTLTQSLLDDAGKDTERSRAAAVNMIPSTSGASKAVVKTIPGLKGRIDGMAIRVPVPTVSFTDITVIVKKPTSVEEVNKAFKDASHGRMKGVLDYETEILVSSDYIGSPYSCTFDANYTKVINDHLVKAYGWYDNEWGYSTRIVDLVEKVGHHI